ncbi:MAG: 50S ribosomal protein L33 [Bacilli bacterium]|nr:50S ribosomal protein L33 [Bacilli bacterium]
MAKNLNRVFFGLKCTECGYSRRPKIKNKKNDPDKMEFHLYCKKCKKATIFKETKLGK